MYLLGFTLNMLTLLALSLVVGILVDDAIVEVENIVRHLRDGQAAARGRDGRGHRDRSRRVATTLTLVAVFLPVAFMSGIAGEFFRPFGWHRSLAVLLSLLVARLVTPMMAAYFLKPSTASPREVALHAAGISRVVRVVPATSRSSRSASAPRSSSASLALFPLLPTGFIAGRRRRQIAI